jgi:hypothetical protein
LTLAGIVGWGVNSQIDKPGWLAEMDAFPFGTADWSRVKEAALPVVNATFAGDSLLRESLLVELRRVLWELRDKYGDHPVLLETEADYIDDPGERRALYEVAGRTASDNGLPTYSIRIALARLLLDEFRLPAQAARELRECEPELATHADESERKEWAELLDQCERHLADL